MALKKIKIGNLIKIVDERNNLGIRDFFGINKDKTFMPTAANTEGLDEKKYKVVRKNRFVFSGMQTGRDQCIRISMYTKESPILVSPAYTTFEIIDEKVIIPMYFFMCFLSKEKDRLGAFYSDGSIRTNLDWARFCEIELEVPDLPIQKKYVNIYSALLKNQLSYERGLEDLKLVCESYIEDLRKKSSVKKIGKYIKCTDRKTDDINLDIRGISNLQKLSIPNSRVVGVEKEKYLRIDYKEFGYSPIHINDGSIALNNEKKSYLLSPIYKTFKVIDENVLYPDYLMMWFSRKEFVRYCWFYAFGSARDNFEWNQMCEVEIPIPDIKIQKSISNIYKCYIERQSINELLKSQIKDICPILIKGSVEEAKEN